MAGFSVVDLEKSYLPFLRHLDNETGYDQGSDLKNITKSENHISSQKSSMRSSLDHLGQRGLKSFTSTRSSISTKISRKLLFNFNDEKADPCERANDYTKLC